MANRTRAIYAGGMVTSPRIRVVIALFTCALVGVPPAVAVPAEDSASARVFEEIRAADMQLAMVGWRLASANVGLCDRLEAGTGLQIHTLDQFDTGDREAARAHFHFATPTAIEGVIPGSPADRAGLRADDSLVRFGPVDIAALPGEPGTTKRLVATQLALAALPAGAPVTVEILRGGAPVQVTVTPVAACKSRFELLLGRGYNASADGTMVQIGARFLDYPADQLAAVVAHEFSHNILHHRDRLEARGVNWGLLSGLGANVKYFRQTEIQADLLSLYLLTNAGYDPRGATAFWNQFGPSKAGGFLRSRSHPHWRDRVRTMEAEIARIAANPARPAMPALLADRDKPLDGDWQSILITK
ncbi:M48 family metalloprotease [Sphingomonas sp. CJ20]